MKNLGYLVFFFTSLIAQSYTVAVTDVVLEYINPKYIETKLLEVRGNKDPSTESNTIDMVTRIIKDLPSDAKILVRLYLLNSENKKIKLLHTSFTPLCKGDENYNYLPSIIKLFQTRSKCITKGQYEIRNVKDVNFSNLVPDLDRKGQFFRLEFTVYSFWTGRILKGYSSMRSATMNSNYDETMNYNQVPNNGPNRHMDKDNTYASGNNYVSSSNDYNTPMKNYGHVGPASSGLSNGNKY